MTSETAGYNIDIILSTENGELPTDEEVRQLVIDQMAGELDERTGLACLAVNLQGRITDPDDDEDRSYIYKGIE